MEDDYGTDEAIWLIMIYEILSFSPTPSPQQTCKGQWGSAPSVKNAVACQKEVETRQRNFFRELER